MSEIKFSKEEKALIVARIQGYFEEEMQQSIGGFDAEFLLDFFTTEIGSYFYNRGLYDAEALLSARLEEIGESIFQLEKQTRFLR